MDEKMKMPITIIGLVMVIVLTTKLIYTEFIKKEDASGWALACMMASSLNIMWIAFSKYLQEGI